jgi:hypothetical protein
MGNRAVITFKDDNPENIAIYLHWNGGRDSVEAFCEAARLLGLPRDISDDYAVGRFIQMVGNFFAGCSSFGVGKVKNLDCDNGDNGLYILGKGFEIIGRRYAPSNEQQHHSQKELVRDIVTKNEQIRTCMDFKRSKTEYSVRPLSEILKK